MDEDKMMDDKIIPPLFLKIILTLFLIVTLSINKNQNDS